MVPRPARIADPVELDPLPVAETVNGRGPDRLRQRPPAQAAVPSSAGSTRSAMHRWDGGRACVTVSRVWMKDDPPDVRDGACGKMCGVRAQVPA